jgi:hypothetical protein
MSFLELVGVNLLVRAILHYVKLLIRFLRRLGKRRLEQVRRF